MLQEILLESLCFLDRASLEAFELVSRKCKRTIDKCNSTLPLRRMDTLSLPRCKQEDDPECEADRGSVQFHHSATEVHLRLGVGPLETTQPLADAQEMVARTSNTYIEYINVYCVECAVYFIAFWRGGYDERRPCKVSSLSPGTMCTLTTDVKALFQPFMFSTLGVTSYDIIDDYEWGAGQMPADFEALWTAWDRRTVQLLELDLDSTQMFTSIFGRMLAEPSHEGRHYSLRGKAKVVRQVVEDYVEKFETAEKGLCFPQSLFIRHSTRSAQSMCVLRHRSPRTLAKPPAVRNWNSLGTTYSESACDVYEVKNFSLRQTLRAYFWIATSNDNTFPVDFNFHCFWFDVASF